MSCSWCRRNSIKEDARLPRGHSRSSPRPSHRIPVPPTLPIVIPIVSLILLTSMVPLVPLTTL
ncbi:uncharacterized protein MYCGRDRAFT_102767 [Zymoseptoria tritici IPO323]|uniref:Uncharacterized protein n=1 Tax=Zymoseptoria tritici (strain CBS 115943 / IPO323) TaxID=336722 RepID=F9X0I2_ZYMTI|nr:uncharacterized protein MYCGRDRAFT_102767 [Zymoseptoria tritici IPO323]EGP91548.1 hypothetical protein MYCGRDRAFT_102767 [Zymoseptoria tritici IPO323]